MGSKMVEDLQNILKNLNMFTPLLITNQRAMGRITERKSGCLSPDRRKKL
jgi:hypothetical protein